MQTSLATKLHSRPVNTCVIMVLHLQLQSHLCSLKSIIVSRVTFLHLQSQSVTVRPNGSKELAWVKSDSGNRAKAEIINGKCLVHNLLADCEGLDKSSSVEQ